MGTSEGAIFDLPSTKPKDEVNHVGSQGCWCCCAPKGALQRQREFRGQLGVDSRDSLLAGLGSPGSLQRQARTAFHDLDACFADLFWRLLC